MIELSNVPDNEPCDFLSVSEARKAAEDYISCIIRFCGEPPEGTFSIERDSYSGWFSVIFKYKTPNGQAYANHLIQHHPVTWEGAGSLPFNN